MKILAIETATIAGSVAIIDDNAGLVGEIRVDVKVVHAERLMPSIEWLLKASNFHISDFDAFAVSIGPGSFTGIRVSLAFCKGISSAANIPLIGVPTLDVLAQSLSHMNGHFLCPIIDAKKSEVFISLYHASKGELKKLIDDRAVKPGTVTDIIQKPCICFGTGIIACEPFMHGTEGIKIEKNAYKAVTADALIKTGIDTMKNSMKYNAKLIYGRKSEAEIKFNVTVD